MTDLSSLKQSTQTTLYPSFRAVATGVAVAVALLCAAPAQAQLPAANQYNGAPPEAGQPWQLDQCVGYARTHNLQAQQQQLQVQQAAITLRGAVASFFPTASADAVLNNNFGFVIDPTTNSIQPGGGSVNTNFNLSASAQVPIFQGGLTRFTYQQRLSEMAGNIYQYEKTVNDLSLNVALSYIQVLFAKEQLTNARARLAGLQSQRDRTAKLVAAGSVPQNELLTIDAQLAAEQLSGVNAENALATQILTLQQQMNLPITDAFDVASPTLPDIAGATLPPLADIYAGSRRTLPDFKLAEENLRAANWGLKAARATRYPSLNGFGGISTRGSSASLEGIPFLNIPGTPYNKQIANNLGQNIGLSLSVPISSRYTVNNNIAFAQLNIRQQELQRDIIAQNVDRNVQQAYQDVVSAQRKYRAVGAQTTSNQTAYDFAQRRFEAGLLNSVDLLNVQNQYIFSQSDLLQAKYDFVFKLKVLDFYQGRPLSF